MLNLGICDRASLKAYFGVQTHVSRRSVERLARYQSGTVSLKTIELMQRIPRQTGYLESFGLVSFELKGKTWFMNLQKEAILVPTLVKTVASMQNFSLSHIEAFIEEGGSRGETHMVAPLDVEAAERTLDDDTSVTTNKQQQHRMRERNLASEHIEAYSLSMEESAAVNSVPVFLEPDRARFRSPGGGKEG